MSLRQHTTRTHFPGDHRVELVVNGREVAGIVVPVLAEARSTQHPVA